MQRTALLALSTAVFCAAGCWSTPHTLLPASTVLSRRVADAYGLQAWPRIHEVAFTFHVMRDGKEIHRSWDWHPLTDEVVYRGAGPDGKETEVRYRRAEVTQKPALAAIDAKFVNDEYWLLFPLHLVWDWRTQKTVAYGVRTPIARTPATKLTVVYPKTGGYTPGDAYDHIIGDDVRIHEWSYRKGDAKSPTLTATWQGTQDFGGIRIALNHLSADKKTRIYFTGVSVH